MKQLGVAIIKATNEAMELGLDIREVYVTEWAGDKNGIDYVQVTVEHSVSNDEPYQKLNRSYLF
jgi:flagellar basal body-associated protein FliL